MIHLAQVKFCKQVRNLYPQHFKNVNAIDVGSLDINGNNRQYFKRSYYIGIDLFAGKNVNVIGLAHEVIPFIQPKIYNSFATWNDKEKRIQYDYFDTIISTEALEHDKHLTKTLTTAYNKLRKGGLLLITCAGDGRKEHGTKDHYPESSPGTNDYYCNVTNKMFSDVLPPVLFTTYFLRQIDGDLQFYGIKK